MRKDRTFEDKLQRFEAAVSSAPSVADDVMQRVRDKPIPVRRRRWTRSPATAACAVAVVCLVGVTIAGWIVAASRDSVNVALNSGNQHSTEHVAKNHELAKDLENQPKVMKEPDATVGSAPKIIHRDVHNPRPRKEQNGNAGLDEQRIGWNLDYPPRGGDDEIEVDRLGMQPGNTDRETPAGSLPDDRDGEQRPADPVTFDLPRFRPGDMSLGETKMGDLRLRESTDGLPADTVVPSGQAPKNEAASWGPTIKGLQCRLRVEKTTLKAGQWPRLLVVGKHGGDRELSLGEAPDFWELECDGAWYRAGVWFSGDIKLELAPSSTLRNFPLHFEKRWKWHARGGNKPLVFEPGRHVLRVALQPAPKHGRKWPRVVSNPIEIEILPGQPAAD